MGVWGEKRMLRAATVAPTLTTHLSLCRQLTSTGTIPVLKRGTHVHKGTEWGHHSCLDSPNDLVNWRILVLR